MWQVCTVGIMTYYPGAGLLAMFHASGGHREGGAQVALVGACWTYQPRYSTEYACAMKVLLVP